MFPPLPQMLPVQLPKDPKEEETLTKQQVSHCKDKQLDLLVLASDHRSQPPDLTVTVTSPAGLKTQILPRVTPTPTRPQ